MILIQLRTMKIQNDKVIKSLHKLYIWIQDRRSRFHSMIIFSIELFEYQATITISNYSLVIFRAEAISDIRIAREFTHTYVEKALVPQNTL